MIIAKDSVNMNVDSVFSDIRGFYSFNSLPPGKYLIEVRASGFQVAIYKNIIAPKIVVNPGAGRDISNATRLQIVLTPTKPK